MDLQPPAKASAFVLLRRPNGDVLTVREQQTRNSLGLPGGKWERELDPAGWPDVLAREFAEEVGAPLPAPVEEGYLEWGNARYRMRFAVMWVDEAAAAALPTGDSPERGAAAGVATVQWMAWSAFRRAPDLRRHLQAALRALNGMGPMAREAGHHPGAGPAPPQGGRGSKSAGHDRGAAPACRCGLPWGGIGGARRYEFSVEGEGGPAAPAAPRGAVCQSCYWSAVRPRLLAPGSCSAVRVRSGAEATALELGPAPAPGACPPGGYREFVALAAARNEPILPHGAPCGIPGRAGCPRAGELVLCVRIDRRVGPAWLQSGPLCPECLERAAQKRRQNRSAVFSRAGTPPPSSPRPPEPLPRPDR